VYSSGSSTSFQTCSGEAKMSMLRSIRISR
jgi:hypothetical protein